VGELHYRFDSAVAQYFFARAHAGHIEHHTSLCRAIHSFFSKRLQKRKPKKRAVFVDRGLTEGQIFSLSAQMSAVPLSRGNELLFLIRLAWARATPVCSFTVVRSTFRRKPLLIHSLYGANRFTQGSCVFFAVSHKSTNSLTFACPSECPEFTPLAGLTETTAALIPRTFNPI